jgi:hypothetical protein
MRLSIEAGCHAPFEFGAEADRDLRDHVSHCVPKTQGKRLLKSEIAGDRGR